MWVTWGREKEQAVTYLYFPIPSRCLSFSHTIEMGGRGGQDTLRDVTERECCQRCLGRLGYPERGQVGVAVQQLGGLEGRTVAY